MKKRITKKECTKHGFNSWIKEGSRKANAMDEHCCLRNNWRKTHKLPMFRLAWKKTIKRKHIKIFE